MSAKRNKLLRYHNISVPDAFAKEAHYLQAIQEGTYDQVLMLWQCKTPTLVLPAGNKWPLSDELVQHLSEDGWQVHARKTGGAPVPQCEGVINVSHIYVWSCEEAYSITLAYESFCQALQLFFKRLNINTQAHATDYAYCDGDYNLNINGKKVVGTAQRVVLKKGGGKVVLAQAFILIDVLVEALVAPVNQCYAISGIEERVKASVHTALFEHITQKPNIDALFGLISHAFIDSISASNTNEKKHGH